MKIYLVRHGLLGTDLELSDAGKSFARSLDEIIEDDIELIVSDSASRCVETITPLAEIRKIKPILCAKTEFQNGSVLRKINGRKSALICYRIESVNSILQELNLDKFTDHTRNQTYENIIVVDTKTNKRTSIPTGYGKSSNQST